MATQTEIAWETAPDVAWERAADEGLPVLIDFTAAPT